MSKILSPNMRSGLIRFLLVFAVALGLAYVVYHWAHRFDYPPNIANKFEVQRLLKTKKFDELELLLSKYDKLLASDVVNEYSVYDEYAAFYVVDSSIEPSLDAWIKVKPNSANAFLARALHKTQQGWYRRGSGWASETSEKQFLTMREEFELAKKDAEIALSLDATKFVAYLLLIEINVGEGNRERQRFFFDEGVRQFPDSVLIHYYYMFGIAPRWGGSYEEMNEFIAQLQKKSKGPLRALAGFIDYDKGLTECNNRRNESAVNYFNKALSYGKFFLYLERRGNCLLRIKKYDSAMEDAQQLIQLRPQYSGALELRGSCYALMNKLDEANRDFNLAKSIDPMDGSIGAAKYAASEIKVVEAYDFAKKMQWSEAFDSYKLALQIDPDNPQAYIFRGRNYFQRREFDLAILDLSHAVEIAPHELNAYGYLTEVFCRQKRYGEAIRSWSKYIALEPQKSEGYGYRAQVYVLMGDLVSAKQDLKKACDLGNQKGCSQLAEFSK